MNATLSEPPQTKCNMTKKYTRIGGIRVSIDPPQKTNKYVHACPIGPVFKIGKHTRQVVQWTCGCIKCVHVDNLIKGRSVCDCRLNESIQKEIDSKSKRANAATKNPAYVNLKKAKQRCYNTNHHKYPDYGGRGITVCERWREPNGQGFINFLEDMGPKPSPQHTLDRKDNDGNYEPSNCRWATRKEQQNNRRGTMSFTLDGKTMCASEWAELLGCSISTLSNRRYSGLSDAEALNTPIKPAIKKPRKAKSL